jgi:DNA-binding Lrp family transcriptional regulator
MDSTDIILCEMLLANSRIPYRYLADKLHLSVNAVHKRIRSLQEMGVIRGFTTRLSIVGLGAITVIIFGKGDSRVLEEAKPRLIEAGNVYWLSVASGDMIVVGAYLRGLQDLDAHVRLVNDALRLESPFVGIMTAPQLADAGGMENRMKKLDYQIVSALRRNSRKNAAEVAAELSVSAKTVRRRLAWMEENNLVEFSLDWYPDAANDIITLYQVYVGPGTETWKLAMRILNELAPNTLFPMFFSNAPELFFIFTWTPTVKDLSSLRRRITDHEGVRKVVPNIVFYGVTFETWRDRLIEEGAARKGTR